MQGSNFESLTEEEILDRATIYKEQDLHPLSNYQQSINKASCEICIANPGMLLGKRSKLIEAARNKVIQEGFSVRERKIACKKICRG